MRLNFGVSIAALTLLALTGCGDRGRHDYYDFDLQKPIDYRQLVFRSSMIIVGTVKGVSITRSGTPARKAPELLLDETQVDVEVENVLRGDWAKPMLRFYFFGLSAKSPGGYDGPPLYRVAVGERRIFFLTIDAGEFRSAADVRGDYSFRVRSGHHRNFRRSESSKSAISNPYDSRAVGDDISGILLELGEEPDLNRLASSLSEAEAISSQLTGLKKTAARLTRLAAMQQSLPLRLGACRVLTELYPGQSGCLSAMQNEPLLTTEDRRQVEALVANRKKWDAQLKMDLRVNPLLAFGRDSLVEIQEELELLVASPDAELRQLACAAFRQNFPGELIRCSHAP